MPTPTATTALTLLTVPEAAARLTLSSRYVWNLIARGDLPVIRLGPRTTRIDAAEIDRLIEAARSRSK